LTLETPRELSLKGEVGCGGGRLHVVRALLVVIIVVVFVVVTEVKAEGEEGGGVLPVRDFVVCWEVISILIQGEWIF
jgi:hypothetical protein